MKTVIGQEKLTEELNRVLDIFKAGKGAVRPHFVLAGPSGSGKTYI